MANNSEVATEDILQKSKCGDQDLNMNDSSWQEFELLQDVTFSNETLQQPSLSPEKSYVFIIICTVFMVPGIYLHSLIIKMVCREKKKTEYTLMSKALFCYAVVFPVFQMIGIGYVFGIIPHVYPPADTIGSWFCFSIEYTSHFIGIYVGILSLLVAVMKYRWIVHNDKMARFGEENAINLFLILHFGIPLVVSLINLVSNGNKDIIPVVDECWGHTEKTHIDENGVLEYFCYYRRYDIKKYIGEKAGNFFEPVLRGTCGCLKILYFIFFSNITELMAYVYLWKHLDR